MEVADGCGIRKRVGEEEKGQREEEESTLTKFFETSSK